MPLRPGARFGRYEVRGFLEAGGMGEVYRAFDARLGREVALKILPESFAGDPDRLRRFDREGRAVGALNHPNVLAVHDVGSQDTVSYIVTELLEGQTLRDALRSARMSMSRAVDCGIQIARGLAAAHAKGIVHRDIKPANLFLTRDGQLKILDFGLARVTPEREAGPEEITHTTETGSVLGTTGYMSPEQIRSETVDSPSDIFALGAVLYEMLSGHHPFASETRVETLAAILNEDPPAFAGAVPPALDRIVRRCLEKRADDRFHSAHDLALALEAVGTGAPTPTQRHPSSWKWWGAGVALAGTLVVAALEWRRHQPEERAPSFRQLTFRRGNVFEARFMPDGQTVVYEAAWEGRPSEIFVARLDSPDPRPLGLDGADLVGTAPGQILVVLPGREKGKGPVLARVSVDGGPPRDLARGVSKAGASQDGSRLAILRTDQTLHTTLEFPIGKRVYETDRRIERLGVSPSGQRVAFVEGGPNGPPRSIRVAGSDGVRLLSGGWSILWGLSWGPDEREVWFTAAREGRVQELRAVDLSGHERLVLRIPGSLQIHDLFRDGRVLLTQREHRSELRALGPEGGPERDISWLGYSIAGSVSKDGKTVLFTEEGGTSGPEGAVCLRRLEDPSPLRLGEGWAMDLSPDGQQALTRLVGPPSRLRLVPTGPGEARDLPVGSLVEHDSAWFFPDGDRLLIMGREKGQKTRFFEQALGSGVPRPLPIEGFDTSFSYPLSPDGREMLVFGKEGWGLQALTVGVPRPIPGLEPGDAIRMGEDNRSLFVREAGPGWPVRVSKLDLLTGRRQPWMDLKPSDLAGAQPPSADSVVLTADGRRGVYQLHRLLANLYVVEGLR